MVCYGCNVAAISQDAENAMITIHATKKLLAKLPVNELGLLPNNSDFDDAQPAYQEKLVHWVAVMRTY